MLDSAYDIKAVCSHERPLDGDLLVYRYREPSINTQGLSHDQSLWPSAIFRAKEVAAICSKIRLTGWNPDCILAHPGWGETLAIRDIWPTVPQILWPELWLRPEHAGFGTDPLLPSPEPLQFLEHLGRNSLTKLSLQQADSWILPTHHQANSLPIAYHSEKMHIIHEGIDNIVARPNASASFSINNIQLIKGMPIVTFVNRNLERLRGFDSLMRAIPLVQALHPSARFLIVGGNESGYGPSHPSGRSFRDVLREELDGQIDFTRVHFLGRVPYLHLIAIMQISAVHVYLSYPFILGWSLLEAMSCGCSIVGSTGMPVEEVIMSGYNGLLVPQDNPNHLAKSISLLLSDKDLRERLSKQARITASAWSKTATIPKITKVINSFCQ